MNEVNFQKSFPSSKPDCLQIKKAEIPSRRFGVPFPKNLDEMHNLHNIFKHPRRISDDIQMTFPSYPSQANCNWFFLQTIFTLYIFLLTATNKWFNFNSKMKQLILGITKQADNKVFNSSLTQVYKNNSNRNNTKNIIVRDVVSQTENSEYDFSSICSENVPYFIFLFLEEVQKMKTLKLVHFTEMNFLNLHLNLH